jgi:hypothetical protein
MRKVRIRLIEPTKNKLQFVKVIKDCTNLGLVDSKYVCDDLHQSPHKSREVVILDGFDKDGVSYLEKLKSGLNALETGNFTVGLAQQIDRDIKLLKLGLVDDCDYITFIEDFIASNEDSSIFDLIMSKLSKDDIFDIFNEICKKIEQ